MNAIILSVGDELVLGQTVDTNSAWISQQLAAVGCEVRAHQTVPDDHKAIADAIRVAIGLFDYIIISGGIGPTADDLTRQALADVLRVPLLLNQSWLDKLIEFFRSRRREMPEMNRIQAMIPQGADMIENTAGTAAGIDALLPLPGGERAGVRGQPSTDCTPSHADRHGTSPPSPQPSPLAGRGGKTRIFVMPGVPKEMKIMFTRDVLPHIQKAGSGAVILSRTLHTFGLGESAVAEKIGDLMMRQKNPSVGTTVANGIVSLRINARFPSRDEATKQLEQTTEACRAALGDLVFGQDDQTLPQVIADLFKQKSQAEDRKSRTVATAESCTGGLLAKMLTDIPGSTDYFKQGWVTYSNKAKTDRLGVSENIINVHGAVSEPVVEAMAKAALRLAKSDYALAISGIAGPGGGTEHKPVGTVCLALAHASGVETKTHRFTGDREMIRDRAAKMALTMLRFHLLGKSPPL